MYIIVQTVHRARTRPSFPVPGFENQLSSSRWTTRSARSARTIRRSTRALCPPPSLGEQIAAHSGYVRGYLLGDGSLHLSLMADAGIYVWEPGAEEQEPGSAQVARAHDAEHGKRNDCGAGAEFDRVDLRPVAIEQADGRPQDTRPSASNANPSPDA